MHRTGVVKLNFKRFMVSPFSVSQITIPSPASASPGKRGVPEVIEKERFFWFDFTGWWLVDADGEVGWAPALYLEPADEMSETEVSNVRRFPISKGTLDRRHKICDTKKKEVHKHRTRLLSNWYGVYHLPTEAIIITNICLSVKYLIWLTGREKGCFLFLFFFCNTKICKAFHFPFKDFLSLFYWKMLFHP